MLKMCARALTALSLLVLAAACGGGDNGGTNPPVPVGGFTVSLSSTTLSVQQGASGSITASIARTGSFTGTVNLSTENVPTGITAAFNPAAITTSTTSTTLTVDVAATVAPGSYTFTIRGQAAGITDQQTATVSMTVTPRPAIAIALSPTSASVVQGGNTTFTATVTPTNFTGATSVAITGAPTGVTTSVTAAGNTHTVAVTVGAATATGTYTLTATASGTGVTSVAATFSLTVTAPPAGVIGLAAAPPALTAQAGGASVTTTLTITRTNFVGNVTVGVQSGLPAGATVTFNPGPTTSDGTSIATFTAGASTAPGTYNVVLQATGTGATTGTVTIALTVTAAPTGSITIAATPNALNATAGGAGVASTIAITRTNYTGDVTFSVTGMPAGSQSGFNPSPVTGNSTTMTLTFGGTVTAGTYPINVTANGTNIAPVTIQVMVTVAPAPQGSIALSITQNPVNVVQGGSGNTSIVIARTNFTGQVNLAVTGVPANVTATLGSPSTLTNGSTLTFAAANNAAPGNYTITVTGTGTNIPNATTTLTLTVTAASSGNVSYTFCTAPLWVAYQDGAGTWTRATSTGNNTYAINVTSTGGLAYVMQDANGEYDLAIQYGTLSEFQASNSCNTATPGTKSHTGSVSGLGFTEMATITMGGGSATANFASLNFTLNNVPNQATDLVAVRSAIAGTGSIANNAIIQRGLNLANGASVGTLAFGAGALTPSTHTATVTGAAGGETVIGSNSFITATGSSGMMTAATNVAGSFTFAAIPAASTLNTDMHVLSALAQQGSGLNQEVRTVTHIIRNGANQTLALGPVLANATVGSVSTAPYRRVRFQAAKQAEYSSLWLFGWTQGSTGSRRDGTIMVTNAYIGSVGSIDISIPDFTGVAGWNNAWAPMADIVNYSFNAYGWNLGGGFGQPSVDGAIVKGAIKLGSS
ncbi:MAG: hypothetical protein JNL26_11250 [Gemmatimonadetes bacterium]|nr:hypothetical protein [Gemmatimonadota bacterium]